MRQGCHDRGALRGLITSFLLERASFSVAPSSLYHLALFLLLASQSPNPFTIHSLLSLLNQTVTSWWQGSNQLKRPF